MVVREPLTSRPGRRTASDSPSSAILPCRDAHPATYVSSAKGFICKAILFDLDGVLVICADEISQGKPHPEGYLTAAARLAVSPGDCIVVEDTPPGIEAAHNAQMRAIAVSTTYSREHLADADLIVARLTDLQIAARGDSIRITT